MMDSEREIRHLLLLAFGDNVISLYLLDQIEGEKHIVGTDLTADVMEICGWGADLLLERPFSRIPAFYDANKRGVLAALFDFWRMILFLIRIRARSVSFEKVDFRSSLLSRLLFLDAALPEWNTNIYFDRKRNLERVHSASIDLHRPGTGSGGKRILINPTSRLQEKNIAPADLRVIVDLLRRNGKEVVLIDYDGVYAGFESRVDEYHTRTALTKAAALLREADFYIGADSFFVHLAYVFRKPFYIFFNRRNDYFMPPYCMELGNYVVRPEIANEDLFLRKLEDDFGRLDLF